MIDLNVFEYLLILVIFFAFYTLGFSLGYIYFYVKYTKMRNACKENPVRNDKEVSPNTYNAKYKRPNDIRD